MAKSQKSCMEQEEIIDTFGTYHSASIAGYAMILARHVAIIRARHNYHAAHRSSKSMYDNEDQVMRRCMLHGNVSRKGYGNALLGRYGGCFEERDNEAYDD